MRLGDSKRMSGGDWYKLEAYRAVNQAIGRVIRHKNDFGAIFFLDKRFNDASVKSSLTDWASENLKSASLSEAISSNKEFFARVNKDWQPGAMKTAAAASSLSLTRKRAGAVEAATAAAVAGNLQRAKKKIVITNAVGNVLRYKATNVVANMKQKLSKAELSEFKSTLRAYKDSMDLSDLLHLLKSLKSDGKLTLEEVMGLKEFVLEDHCPAYERFLQTLQR